MTHSIPFHVDACNVLPLVRFPQLPRKPEFCLELYLIIKIEKTLNLLCNLTKPGTLSMKFLTTQLLVGI